MYLNPIFGCEEESEESETKAGILFVCREVLPSFSNWRYQIPGQREQILILCLSILLQYINSNPAGRPWGLDNYPPREKIFVF